MRVSAHNVVINFGIDALKMFWNLENENEIKQCLQDWRIAHAVKVCLKSFNDGNNIFEVIADLDNCTAWRNDIDCDVTSDYQMDIFKEVAKRDDARRLFNLPSLMNHAKLAEMFKKD